MKVLIVGAGWAGLAAAIETTRLGHHATVLEATRAIGGRARALKVPLLNGPEATLDNGQHILIGAYSETLRLLHDVGVDTGAALHRLPLSLRYPDGHGLTLPDWQVPWFAGLDVAAGVLSAKGWTLGDKLSVLRAADAWRRGGFACPAHYSVARLCQGITPRVMQEMIDPLVVSALNTPSERASASVFLTVMRDALFAAPTSAAGQRVAGSNMLLPRTDLGALFPDAAARWLAAQGARLLLGQRLSSLDSLSISELLAQYPIGLEAEKACEFDATILAVPAWEAARLVRTLAPGHATEATVAATTAAQWADTASALQHEAITTVYAYSAQARLAQPVLALRSNAEQPAQFVFDRGVLGGPSGLLAFVVSASVGDAATLERQVLAQGRSQLGLADLQAVKTIVEKRATFACTPGLQRPSMRIASGVLACGDYIDGPYPATLEGAVRSGLAAARAA